MGRLRQPRRDIRDMEVPALLTSCDTAHLLKPREASPAQDPDIMNLNIAAAKLLLFLSPIKQKLHMQ